MKLLLAYQPGSGAKTLLSGVMSAWSLWYVLLVKPGKSVYTSRLVANNVAVICTDMLTDTC